MLLEADRLGQMSSAQGNTVLKLSFSPHISSSRLLKPLRDIAPLGSDYWPRRALLGLTSAGQQSLLTHQNPQPSCFQK